LAQGRFKGCATRRDKTCDEWDVGLDLQQKGEGFGDLFNPVWGSYVESQTRLQTAQACIDNNILPLSIAVDGILSNKPLNKLPLGDRLGDWRLSSKCPSIVVSSGVVAVKDKENVAEFSLDYDWLKKQAEDNPEASSYEMTKLSPVTLAKAINDNKLEDLGKLKQITRSVDLKYEVKRMYKDQPANGRQLMKGQYQSYPIDVSLARGFIGG